MAGWQFALMPPTGNDVIAYNLGGTHRCDLCGQCTVMKRAGLYHFSNECTHAGLARFQRTLRFACLDLVLELARRVRATCGRGIERHRAALHRIGGTAEHKYAQHRVGMMATIDDVVRHLTVSVRAARNDPAVWGNAYMQAMVYQTLLALPFSIYALTYRPQGVVPPLVVQHMAMLYQGTVLPNNEMRPLATRWVMWSAKRLLQLASILKVLRTASKEQARALRSAASGTMGRRASPVPVPPATA